MTLVEELGAVPERSLREVVRTVRGRAREAAGHARGRLRRTGPQLTCAALLVVIAATTGLVVWLCWQAAADARLRLSAAPEGSPGQLETSLLADARPDRSPLGTTAPSVGAGAGVAAGVPAAPAAPRGQGGPTVPGPVLASAGSAAAVAGGAAAVWVVLRRYRRREEPVPEVAPPPTWVERDDAVDDDAPTALDDQARPDPDQSDDAPQPEEAHELDEVRPARRSSAGTLESPAVVPLQLRGLDVAGAAASTALDDRPPVAGQRLYERRSVPRVDYAQDAVLLLGDERWSVRTLNLSEKGLGCRAVPPLEGAVAPALPKPPANVRVRVPLGGEEVELRAQVVWRRSTRAGQEAGLTFSGLTDAELAVLRRTCAALEPVTR